MPNSEENVRLAVLMTCHNRVANTLDCLEALRKQQPFGASFDLFLVDDGSTDGTARAVQDFFPGAIIIQGDGNLYWCGGMRVAFAQAMQNDYDFYLWLNDDTQLDNDALLRVFHAYADASSQLGDLLIAVGSTRDRESGAVTYGRVAATCGEAWLDLMGKNSAAYEALDCLRHHKWQLRADSSRCCGKNWQPRYQFYSQHGGLGLWICGLEKKAAKS